MRKRKATCSFLRNYIGHFASRFALSKTLSEDAFWCQKCKATCSFRLQFQRHPPTASRIGAFYLYQLNIMRARIHAHVGPSFSSFFPKATCSPFDPVDQRNGVRTMNSPKSSLVSQAIALVAPAEAAFSSRWHMSTLAKIDPELHDLVNEQRFLFEGSLLTGTEHEVREQSEAMVRGWSAACRRMEHPLQPDDAYLVGSNLDTFTTVVIGHCKQSAARYQVKDGNTVVFMTPDEVAALFGSMATLRKVKELFPDAEIANVSAVQ